MPLRDPLGNADKQRRSQSLNFRFLFANHFAMCNDQRVVFCHLRRIEMQTINDLIARSSTLAIATSIALLVTTTNDPKRRYQNQI